MGEKKDSYVRGFAKGIVNVLSGGVPVLDEQLQGAARDEERQERDRPGAAAGSDAGDGAEGNNRR